MRRCTNIKKGNEYWIMTETEINTYKHQLLSLKGNHYV
ncbi:MAG: hypothetical protein ACI8UG_002066 [Gammaproteobacteria bacterium]|jgi:hypothetical protein